jgi:hypothetical protein
MFKATAFVSEGNYILVQGEAPILLLAHLDTVHQTPVKSICKTENGSILMSPEGIGGDDRCGVYALVNLHRSATKKPWLLFTCDEETGGVGASKFCEHHLEGKLPKGVDGMKLLVEIDRKGKKDAVYYDCANKDFEKYITSKGFKTEWGSFSDISYVAPELGVAAVNLSSGYYNAHTTHEYINRSQLDAVVKKVAEIIVEANTVEFPRYEYIESRLGRWTDVWDFGKKIDTKNYVGGWYDDPNSLDDIPMEILNEYIELTDYYSYEELDELRRDFGDSIITQLYKDEILEGKPITLPDEEEDADDDFWRMRKWNKN